MAIHSFLRRLPPSFTLYPFRCYRHTASSSGGTLCRIGQYKLYSYKECRYIEHQGVYRSLQRVSLSLVFKAGLIRGSLH